MCKFGRIFAASKFSAHSSQNVAALLGVSGIKAFVWGEGSGYKIPSPSDADVGSRYHGNVEFQAGLLRIQSGLGDAGCVTRRVSREDPGDGTRTPRPKFD